MVQAWHSSCSGADESQMRRRQPRSAKRCSVQRCCRPCACATECEMFSVAQRSVLPNLQESEIGEVEAEMAHYAMFAHVARARACYHATPSAACKCPLLPCRLQAFTVAHIAAAQWENPKCVQPQLTRSMPSSLPLSRTVPAHRWPTAHPARSMSAGGGGRQAGRRHSRERLEGEQLEALPAVLAEVSAMPGKVCRHCSIGGRQQRVPAVR